MDGENQNSNQFSEHNQPPKKAPKMPFEGKIQRLGSALYSRNRKFPTEIERGKFTPYKSRSGQQKEWEKKENWDNDEIDLENLERKNSFLGKFFIGAVLFFLISAGIAFFLFYKGENIVSPNNISIDIQGPINIAGGEVLPLDITVKNENNVSINDVNLSIEYPSGTKSADGLSELTRVSEDLGNIRSGDFAKKTESAMIFGEQNSQKEIKIAIDYKVTSSKSTFHKEKTYNIAVISEPVSVVADYLKEINSGQKNNFTLTVSSNSSSVLKNILVIAEYPRGFTFSDAFPKPDFSNNIWLIDELKPEEKKTIKFSGKVEGLDGEDVVFRFRTGLESATDEKNISSEIVSSLETISIKKPFITAQVFLNGDSSDTHIESLGQSINAKIDWLNNLSTNVTDVEITAKILGNVLAADSVSTSDGLYKTDAGTITWNGRTTGALSKVEPAAAGELMFSFSTLKPSSSLVSRLRNPQLNVAVSIKGKRLSESNVPENLDSSVSRTIKFSTNLDINSRLLYYSGPLKNRGSIPPKADSPTTYTVVWTITNSWNDASGVVVKSSLPAFAKWLNVISPASEKVNYKPLTGEVSWEAGDVKAGTGFSSSPREVAFQIELDPNINQINTSPVVLAPTVITGNDNFTNSLVQNEADSLSTELYADPQVKDVHGTGYVTK